MMVAFISEILVDNSGNCSPGLVDLTSDGSDRFHEVCCHNLVNSLDEGCIPDSFSRIYRSGLVLSNIRRHLTINLETFSDPLDISNMQTS